MRSFRFVLLLFVCSSFTQAQNTSSSQILHRIKKLQQPIRVLYLAAHPDDENTRMISWLSNDVGARTAYLSLTRGDGGQNLIGTELGAQLGVLRTQELMQARAIDGGEQFFSRAVDFGYSKNPDETFEHWNREDVLNDVVRVIRSFKPQIIITRFPPDSRAGHGHHTASAMLALEAFDQAADKEAFANQGLAPWQVERIFWNHSQWWEPKIDSLAAADPSYFVVDVGGYLPELGVSCNELASHSRSQHKSQGFGVAIARGKQNEYLKLLKGSNEGPSIFSGLEANWGSLGLADADELLTKIVANYQATAPYNSAQDLLSLLDVVQKSPDPMATWFYEQLAQILADCLGLKVELLMPEEYVVPQEVVKATARIIQRSPLAVSIKDPKSNNSALAALLKLEQNTLLEEEIEFTVVSTLASQPYWLVKDYQGMFDVEDATDIGKPENEPANRIYVQVEVEGKSLRLGIPAIYKFSDRVEGEIVRPLMVVPTVTVESTTSKLVFLNKEAQSLNLDFRGFKTGDIKVGLKAKGWKFSPETIDLSFDQKNQLKTITVQISPEKDAVQMDLNLYDVASGESLKKLVEIDYDHIDKRMILESPGISLIPIDLKISGSKVAYIQGAGDKVPDGIVQMGYSLTILDEQGLREADLTQFEAVILGIRAYNTQEWLWNRQEQLLQYVQEGGKMIVQYNTRSRSFQGSDFAPYPFTISRERVTEENAAVRFALPEHPILNTPNKLSDVDFEAWVQERGLYFADTWDGAYAAPLAWHDKGEPDRLGALLVADYGKGAFIYTGISFFRELPAGVPGAYRLFANIISYQNGSGE